MSVIGGKVRLNTDLDAELERLKAQGYTSICFWLPAYNIGGGTYYFCQLALYLKKHTDLKIYYMDYKDGYPSRILKDANIEILEYRDEDMDFPLCERCVIVTNSTRVIQLKRMDSNNKILFWHYETVPVAWESIFLMNETKKFLKLCHEEKAMVFHDWSGWNAIMADCDWEYDFPHAYLSLFLPPKQETEPTSLISGNEIHLVWLGRFGTEKIYSIYNIITNYAAYKTEKKKVMHLIGDGKHYAAVKAFSKKYSHEIEFIFTGSIKKKNLDRYLLKNADVVFGMGLSAVEGAALRIPSVVVKLDTKMISGDEFWWLFNTKEYCAGILSSQQWDIDITFDHFRDIMDDLCRPGIKEKYGEMCYRYYRENMSSFDDVVMGFLNSLNQCSLTMKKLEECIKYVPYNHVRIRKWRFLAWNLSEKILFQ